LLQDNTSQTHIEARVTQLHIYVICPFCLNRHTMEFRNVCDIYFSSPQLSQQPWAGSILYVLGTGCYSEGGEATGSKGNHAWRLK
jgi:hypothetical protein